MTSTQVPAVQPVIYRYDRESLLKIKEQSNPALVKDAEKVILQKLKHFRLDKNSILTITKPQVKKVATPNANNENQSKKGNVLQVPQSAGPKLGRTEQQQKGKTTTTSNNNSNKKKNSNSNVKENENPQTVKASITPLTARKNNSNTLRPFAEVNCNQFTTPIKPKVNEVQTKALVEHILKTPVMTPNVMINDSFVTPLHLPTTVSESVVSPQFSIQSSYTPTKSPCTPPSASKCETDPHRLKQRQKQIDYGYRTIGYIRYILAIRKEDRIKEHPKTPRKSQACSKRSWDGQVKKWRRELHKWDPEDPAEYEKLMVPEILLSVYGDTPDMPIIVTQLREQIAEFMRTGKLGKVSDGSSDDNENENDNDEEKDRESDRTPSMLTCENQSMHRSMQTDFEKSSTVRMLVF